MIIMIAIVLQESTARFLQTAPLVTLVRKAAAIIGIHLAASKFLQFCLRGAGLILKLHNNWCPN